MTLRDTDTCASLAREAFGIRSEPPRNQLRDIAQELKASGMRCNCDLDNWEPEQRTGHSRVCRIHKAAMERNNYPRAEECELEDDTDEEDDEPGYCASCSGSGEGRYDSTRCASCGGSGVERGECDPDNFNEPDTYDMEAR